VVLVTVGKLTLEELVLVVVLVSVRGADDVLGLVVVVEETVIVADVVELGAVEISPMTVVARVVPAVVVAGGVLDTPETHFLSMLHTKPSLQRSHCDEHDSPFPDIMTHLETPYTSSQESPLPQTLLKLHAAQIFALGFVATGGGVIP
jgi:hypothetical protein